MIRYTPPGWALRPRHENLIVDTAAAYLASVGIDIEDAPMSTPALDLLEGHQSAVGRPMVRRPRIPIATTTPVGSEEDNVHIVLLTGGKDSAHLLWRMVTAGTIKGQLDTVYIAGINRSETPYEREA